MLKIVEDFDLRELKKYGFEFIANRGSYRYKTHNYYASITINSWNRIIKTSNACKELGIVYDLIQAGIVEKVDYEEE